MQLAPLQYGILHLDIKPDNIFLDRHGTYKIGDFGVAWVGNALFTTLF
jgi:serine/threonine protein kinase